MANENGCLEDLKLFKIAQAKRDDYPTASAWADDMLAQCYEMLSGQPRFERADFFFFTSKKHLLTEQLQHVQKVRYRSDEYPLTRAEYPVLVMNTIRTTLMEAMKEKDWIEIRRAIMDAGVTMEAANRLSEYKYHRLSYFIALIYFYYGGRFGRPLVEFSCTDNTDGPKYFFRTPFTLGQSSCCSDSINFTFLLPVCKEKFIIQGRTKGVFYYTDDELNGPLGNPRALIVADVFNNLKQKDGYQRNIDFDNKGRYIAYYSKIGEMFPKIKPVEYVSSRDVPDM